MATNLRPNGIVSDTSGTTSFAAVEVPIASATQSAPDGTQESVVIVFSIYNLRED